MAKAARLAGCVLAGCMASFTASAADFVLSASHVYQTDISWVSFTVGAGGANVSLFTDSYQGGANFDPTLNLFTTDGVLLGYAYDIDSLSNGFDARWEGVLGEGTYRLAVLASPNTALGGTLAEGFLLGSALPEPLSMWCQPAVPQCGAGGLWRLNLQGVESATITTAVPEPASALLLLGGLAAVAGAARRRSAQVHAET